MDSSYYMFFLVPIGGGLLAVLINIISRLSRRETDLKWIKKGLSEGFFCEPDGEK